MTDILNKLHPSITFTMEAAENNVVHGKHIQKLPFLDVSVIVKDHRQFSTDIYYKATNSHFYLDYNSHHPKHVKDNIPYTLAKKIVIFVSDSKKRKFRLNELRKWLINCNYPENIIQRKFHAAKLHGPAPEPKDPNKQLIFISTYIDNYTNDNTIRQINSMFQLQRTHRLQEIFGDCRATIAYKQPRNILRLLTRAAFTFTPPPAVSNPLPDGLYKCNGIKCKLCSDGYVQECTTFTTYNNTEWTIRGYINCNSRNVCYYLKCMACKFKTTYIGKTVNLRDRMNNHISESTRGVSTDKFVKHNFKCCIEHKYNKKPLFKIYVFLKIDNPRALETYEDFLHQSGFDSMNKSKV